jgi:serine/threonine protein phosphatase PrpC
MLQVEQKIRTIGAAASVTKKAVNQDACGMFRNDAAGIVAVAIADGIGSQFGAECASAEVVAAIGRVIACHDTGRPFDMTAAFAFAHHTLQEAALGWMTGAPAGLDPAAAWGTTLLCAVDAPDGLIIGYAGNGAVLHLRGHFDCVLDSQYVPWSAVNYLNPHSICRHGRPVLYRYLSPSAAGGESAPTVVHLSRDDGGFGDLVLLCSDGITSLDQVRAGPDEAGQLWIGADRAVSLLYSHLRLALVGNETDADSLARVLDEYLRDLSAKNLIDDDCTVAALVTGRALAHRRSGPEEQAP